MTLSKAHHYEKECQLLNDLLRAISYPGRQKILRKLRFEGPCTVKQLRLRHPISRTAFSGHLRILVKVQFVTWKHQFPYVIYTINLERLKEAKKAIYTFFESLELDD